MSKYGTTAPYSDEQTPLAVWPEMWRSVAACAG